MIRDEKCEIGNSTSEASLRSAVKAQPTVTPMSSDSSPLHSSSRHDIRKRIKVVFDSPKSSKRRRLS